MCTSTALALHRPHTPPPSHSAALARPPPSCSTALAHPLPWRVDRPCASTALARPPPLRIRHPRACARPSSATSTAIVHIHRPRVCRPHAPPPSCSAVVVRLRHCHRLSIGRRSCCHGLVASACRVPPCRLPAHIPRWRGGARGEREGEESGGVGDDITKNAFALEPSQKNSALNEIRTSDITCNVPETRCITNSAIDQPQRAPSPPTRFQDADANDNTHNDANDNTMTRMADGDEAKTTRAAATSGRVASTHWCCATSPPLPPLSSHRCRLPLAACPSPPTRDVGRPCDVGGTRHVTAHTVYIPPPFLTYPLNTARGGPPQLLSRPPWPRRCPRIAASARCAPGPCALPRHRDNTACSNQVAARPPLTFPPQSSPFSRQHSGTPNTRPVTSPRVRRSPARPCSEQGRVDDPASAAVTLATATSTYAVLLQWCRKHCAGCTQGSEERRRRQLSLLFVSHPLAARTGSSTMPRRASNGRVNAPPFGHLSAIARRGRHDASTTVTTAVHDGRATTRQRCTTTAEHEGIGDARAVDAHDDGGVDGQWGGAHDGRRHVGGARQRQSTRTSDVLGQRTCTMTVVAVHDAWVVVAAYHDG
ncbi:hypothetical protein BJ912DRAFT_926692 [Pholiota molesta]|nr:hypothetical protein BJ912DRAFT_926692 [Pholiota molesta]